MSIQATVNNAVLASDMSEEELNALLGPILAEPALNSNRSVVTEAIPEASLVFDAIDNVLSTVLSTGNVTEVLGGLGMFGAALSVDPAPGTPLFEVLQQV